MPDEVKPDRFFLRLRAEREQQELSLQSIADRIGVMSHGKLEQLGSAEDLYKRPVSRFVAGFIGKCNFIEGRVTGPGRFEAANGSVLQFSGTHAGGPAALCFRPEHAVLGASACAGNSIAVTVKAVTYLGPVTEYDLVSEAGDKLLVSASSTGAARCTNESRASKRNSLATIQGSPNRALSSKIRAIRPLASW